MKNTFLRMNLIQLVKPLANKWGRMLQSESHELCGSPSRIFYGPKSEISNKQYKQKS
jgi:hypothetical protein